MLDIRLAADRFRSFCRRRSQPVQPAKSPEEWAEIETVTVRGAPGPAVWHLTRGNSEVWITGVIGRPAAKDMDWNRATVAADAVRRRPRFVVVAAPAPMSVTADAAQVPAPPWRRARACRAAERLERQACPSDLRARFTAGAARDAVGGDDSKYRTDIPVRAALRLQQDMIQRNAELSG